MLILFLFKPVYGLASVKCDVTGIGFNFLSSCLLYVLYSPESSVVYSEVKKVKARYFHHGKAISKLPLKYGVTQFYLQPDISEHIPTLTPASKAVTQFTYPGGMEGWVDLEELTLFSESLRLLAVMCFAVIVMLNPRGQNFGLGLKDLASASKLWPRPQTFGLGLASISLSCYVIRHFSGKNHVKFWNFC